MSWSLPSLWSVAEPLAAAKLNQLRNALVWLGETVLRVNENPGAYPIRLQQNAGSFLISGASNVGGAETTILTAGSWWGTMRTGVLWIAASSGGGNGGQATLNIHRPTSGFQSGTLSYAGETLLFRVYSTGAITVQRTAGSAAHNVALMILSVT